MKRLYRSNKDKVIAGICGGIGEMTSYDPTIVRMIMIFIALVTAVVPFVLTYIIGWLIIPVNPEH